MLTADNTHAKIIARYLEPDAPTQREVAREVGVSPATVHRTLHIHRVPVRGRYTKCGYGLKRNCDCIACAAYLRGYKAHSNRERRGTDDPYDSTYGGLLP